MSGWDQRILGGSVNQPGFVQPFSNPMQRMNAIMQAMQNPPAFVRQAIPDLPNEISNDPNRILQYLKQTRGVTDQQIQRIAGSMPRF